MAGACFDVLPGVTGLPCDQTPGGFSVQYLQSWQSHHRREVMENVGDGIWYNIEHMRGWRNHATLQKGTELSVGEAWKGNERRQTEKMRAF